MKTQKRNTHSTDAGLEDCLAISLDIILYTSARLEQIQAILQSMRSGPHAYSPETEAAEKPPGSIYELGNLDRLAAILKFIQEKYH